MTKIAEKQYGMRTNQIEPLSFWQNVVEQGIVILTQGGSQLISNTNNPWVLWDWALNFEANIKSCTTSSREKTAWIYDRQDTRHHGAGAIFMVWSSLSLAWTSISSEKYFVDQSLGVSHNMVLALCRYILPFQPMTGEKFYYPVQLLVLLYKRSVVILR